MRFFMQRIRVPLSLYVLVLVLCAIGLTARIIKAAEPLSYNEHIRPILVENCFSCHGADSASRKADLRLDRRDDAIEYGAIVAGDPDSTVLLDRIYSEDPEEFMPPPEIKKTLSAHQKALLTQWIKEGAEYEPHWSFIPPTRVPIPKVKKQGWVRNPIDSFILSKLEAEGLMPAEEADRRTLARRLSYDLTGFPPEPSVVEAFVLDPHADAYERLVDTFLSKLEWGEHRGRHWLDYARYADTHGIHFDNYREMWTYRQWVINAFNRNMPFDQFTILQLAGDLLADHGPDATPDQILDNKIATGFNRCNMTTNEGGIIDEEYIVLYARDRTETTAQVFMGLTAGCAVCHDHKFDPLSQKEFYELSAFFNNTTQRAKDGNVYNTPPILAVPLAEDRTRFREIEKELPVARTALAARKKNAKGEFHTWVQSLTADQVLAVGPQETPLLDIALSEGEGNKTKASFLGKQTTIPLSDSTSWLPGPSGMSAALVNGKAVELSSVGDFEHDQPFTISCWVKPPKEDGNRRFAIASRMDESNAHRGWDLWVEDRRVGMHLIHKWPEDALKVIAKKPIKADVWTLVTLSYNGSGNPGGIKIYYDGVLQQKPQVAANKFKKNTTRTDTAPFVIGSRSKGSPAKNLGLTNVSLWGRALSQNEVESIAKADLLTDIVKLPKNERLQAANRLYDWWLMAFDKPFQTAKARENALVAEEAAIKKRGTIAHVMQEKPDMAKAFVLDRGEYDKRLDEVSPGTPDALPAYPESLPKNRLGLAQWLLLQDHPLTSRVTVNRFWQEVFGTGLVRTSGDFGITGELPSNQDLLDWLAVEFRESGWDVKHLFRLFVTSAAYRQAATATPEKLVKDRDNRLLSRGPRFRMDAEMIRDTALAASGLLVQKIGGPSVKPYQPDGVWKAVAMPESDTKKYEASTGADLYRRSMYWFWKRSAPPTSMDILDAPSREVCTVRRDRTNTPLQALVTLNDPQFIEASRALADDALFLGGSNDDQRIDYIANRLLSRPLDEAEKPVVKKSLADLTTWYKEHLEDAQAVITVGQSQPRHEDAVTLASWTMLTNQLMNLDEVLSK